MTSLYELEDNCCPRDGRRRSAGTAEGDAGSGGGEDANNKSGGNSGCGGEVKVNLVPTELSLSCKRRCRFLCVADSPLKPPNSCANSIGFPLIRICSQDPDWSTTDQRLVSDRRNVALLYNGVDFLCQTRSNSLGITSFTRSRMEGSRFTSSGLHSTGFTRSEMD